MPMFPFQNKSESAHSLLLSNVKRRKTCLAWNVGTPRHLFVSETSDLVKMDNPVKLAETSNTMETIHIRDNCELVESNDSCP